MYDDLTPIERSPVQHDRLPGGPRHGKKRSRGRSGGGGGSKKVSRQRYWLRRAIVLSALALVVAVAGVAGYAWYLNSRFHHTNVSGLQGSIHGTENILLVGSTDRCALKVQNPAYGLCQNGVNGVNSDITMVVHLDFNNGTMALLSIPRDTFIPNARIEGANKIDAALYQGPSQLVAAIQEDFGIPIDHYIELNFDTFADVVNALGGIHMYFPVPVFDLESGLNIRHFGCYYLDGFHALQVVRARHLQIYHPGDNLNDPQSWAQEPESDLARIRRTHEFLRVLAKELSGNGLSNPSTDVSLAQSVSHDLTIDQNLTLSTMVSLAENFNSVPIGSVPQLTYPVIVDLSGSLEYEGGNYGDVVFPIQPGGMATMDQIFGSTPTTSTWDYAPLPAPSSFTTSVENATGVANQAATVAHGLGAHGFRIGATGDRTPTGPISETIVWYGGPPAPKNGTWTSPQMADAQAILRQIQGPAIMGYDPSKVDPGATVTVQTGTDVSIAPVRHVTTTTTQPTTSTSTTVAGGGATPTTVPDVPGVSTDNNFSAPSAIAQPLKPWDPRGCNSQNNGPATT